MPGIRDDLVDLADFAFSRLRTRLEGLGDDEYFWEPAPGCWTLRPDAEGRYHGDWASPVWGPPLTTIAWRIAHVINNLYDPRYASHLGLAPVAAPPPSLPATAAEAVNALEEGYAVTRSYLVAVTEQDLLETLGPVAGPWAADDRASFVLHMLDELIHHGAEIAVLRDLYRAQHGPAPAIAPLLDGDRTAVDEVLRGDPLAVERARSQRPDLVLQAAAEGRRAGVQLLVELGFALAMPDGSSALHQAAGVGDLAIVEVLLGAGADPGLRDPLYRSTSAEWADWFHQPEVAALLRRSTDEP